MVLVDHLGQLRREVMVVVYLGADGGNLGCQVLAQGRGDAIAGRYRRIVEPALRLGACGFVLAHNHPSGDPRPSAQDIRATQGLRALARVLDLEFADHLVVAAGQVTSMRRCGFGFGEAGARHGLVPPRLAGRFRACTAA